MEIQTDYGTIDFSELKNFDIPKKALAFIEEQRDAAELFFQDEIDLTGDNIPKEYQNDLHTLIEVTIAEGKFDEPSRAFAVSEHTGESLADIEQGHDEKRFEIGNKEWLVLTEEEAEEEVIDYTKSSLDDMGLEYINEEHHDYVFENFGDKDHFKMIQQESNEHMANDRMEQPAEDEDAYVNELHEEMVQRGILEEPEYPDEPEPDDFDSDEEYNEAYDAWEAKVEDFRTNLESEVENKVDEYVEQLNEDYKDPLEWYIDNFGIEEAGTVIKDNDLIDWDATARWLVEDMLSRGEILNHYDGNEHDIQTTYMGEKFDYFLYQQS